MLLSAVQNSFLVALYMEIKCRKVYFNMCRYVRSLTDPIEEHKETMSLDKSYFHDYKMMSKPLRMAVKTQLSSMDPIIEQKDRLSFD